MHVHTYISTYIPEEFLTSYCSATAAHQDYFSKLKKKSICLLLADNCDLLHLFSLMVPMRNPLTFLTASQHHIVTNHAFFHGPILSMLVHGENHKYIQQHH